MGAVKQSILKSEQYRRDVEGEERPCTNCGVVDENHFDGPEESMCVACKEIDDEVSREEDAEFSDDKHEVL